MFGGVLPKRGPDALISPLAHPVGQKTWAAHENVLWGVGILAHREGAYAQDHFLSLRCVGRDAGGGERSGREVKSLDREVGRAAGANLRRPGRALTSCEILGSGSRGL